LLYERIRQSRLPHIVELRAELEDMYSAYERHADPHFLREFQIQTHARFWEMYLTRCLQEAGLAVSSFGGKGPDIALLHNGKRIIIEAVQATPGAEDSPDRCPDFPENEAVIFPEEQMLLRYRCALEAKRIKREEYIASGLVAPDDVFIVAINAGGIPMAFVSEDPPRILSALYPIGSAQVIVDVATHEAVEAGYTYRPSVKKSCGSDVRTDVFVDEAYSGISGVVYSGVNLLNMPPARGKDLVLVHSLVASSPVPSGWWPFAEEWAARREGEGLVIDRIHQR
jgi:hypothetical protein